MNVEKTENVYIVQYVQDQDKNKLNGDFVNCEMQKMSTIIVLIL